MFVPITDVFPFDRKCALHVDYHGDEYRVCWTGDWRRRPDLSEFPRVKTATITKIPHSPAVDVLWTSSQVVAHGADVHIRELRNCTDGFPICKVAIDTRQRRLLQYEFRILRFLSTSDLDYPVPKTDPEPLGDDDGIFGFRMEKLHPIAGPHCLEYFNEVERAIRKVHESGVAHNDLSPSNIMLNKDRRVTIIGFGRAGFAGEIVPSYEKGELKRGNLTYSLSLDLDWLAKLHGKITTSAIEFLN